MFALRQRGQQQVLLLGMLQQQQQLSRLTSLQWRTRFWLPLL
jgi:hypothetical protein